MRFGWLMPFPIRGSGGHRTILQSVAALSAAGHENHVYLQAPEPGERPAYRDAIAGRRLVEDYFGPVDAKFHFGLEPGEELDVIFATAWFTAIPLRSLKTRAVKAYLVQDVEAAFQPLGDQYLVAENTLRYGFRAITIGRWLAMKLERDFAASASFFDFCADRSIYRPLDGAQRERAICFVYQPDKPRRCSQIGCEALAIVRQLQPDVRILLYGFADAGGAPFGFENLGLLSLADCNALYNRAAVGLCISTTNPSRIPFEMMATGLPVVDLYGENTLYDLPDEAVTLAEPTPESLAHAMLGLLSDEPRRRRAEQAGLAFMRERDVAVGLAQLVAAAEGLATNTPAIAPIAPIHRAPAVKAGPDDAERYLRELDQARLVHRSRPPSRSLPSRVAARLKHTLRVLVAGR